MKHRKGIFRKGFSVVVWCQNLNFVFFGQRTSIFLKDGMVTNFSVNFEPQRWVCRGNLFCFAAIFQIALIHLSEIRTTYRN